MENKAVIRQIKIKTGSLKRNNKDYTSYAQEQAQQQEKVEKRKAEGASPGDIVRAENELAETMQMLPNSKTRIENSLDELQSLMGEHEGNEELEASEEWAAAKA